MRIWIWCACALWLTEGCLSTCLWNRAPNNASTVVGKFATYEETIAWYYQLKKLNKGLVQLINIGRTHEGRKQLAMRISPFPADTRPAIFIEGGMHAREWLSPSTANYLIAKLIRGYRRGHKWYRRAMKKYVFYIMSITNPDGYAFTFDKSNPENRFWRKNRRRNKNGCMGVDLNRNFDIGFGGIGTSSDPCTEIYHGGRAFSEPESRNIAKFVKRRLRQGIQLYISLHSFAQLWIVPFSFRKKRPKPKSLDKELHRAARVAAKATLRKTGKVYKVENGAEAFGVTTSGSDDWMLAKMKARYSYTLELRPSEKIDDDSGFAPPPSQILPTGRDTLAALKALVNTMRTKDRD